MDDFASAHEQMKAWDLGDEFASADPARFLVKLEPGARAPERGSPGAIGYDLFAHLPRYDKVEIHPGRHVLIDTGVSVRLPAGTYGRVAPRSGLAVKKGIDVLAGVIDPDYRGTIGVALMNNGPQSVTLVNGDKIAQLILEKAVLRTVTVVDSLDDTLRSDRGFGSTGL